MLILGIVAFQSISAFGQQSLTRPNIPLGVRKAMREAGQRSRPDAIAVENGIIALSHVLHQWSGHRSYENLVIALSEEVAKQNSVEPLVTTALRMTELGALLERPELYREGLAVIQSLAPEMADDIQERQTHIWPTSSSGSNLTVYEKLKAQYPDADIFGTEVFEDVNATGKDFIERSTVVHERDINKAQVQSPKDYIADAIYGSFQDPLGGARQSRNNPILQQIMAQRDAESSSAGYQYYQSILTDAMQSAGAGGVLGGGIGMWVGSMTGGPVGAMGGGTLGTGIGTTGGFFVGAVGGAIARYDDYQDGKKAQEEAEQRKKEDEKENQKKAEREKTEARDHELKEKARKDEEETAKLDYADQISRTATGVNPDRIEDTGSDSVHFVIDLLNRFHKLINVREGLESDRGIIIIQMPNSGSADPSHFDFENGHGFSIQNNKIGFVDPANPSKSRGTGR